MHNHIILKYKEIEGQYTIIDNSIDYYLCLLETSIYYLKECDDAISEYSFCNYLKYIYFNNKYKNVDICRLIQKNISFFNSEIVVALLLYPDYYFYLFCREDINSLKKVVNRHAEYEKYIKIIVNEINKYSAKKIILFF